MSTLEETTDRIRSELGFRATGINATPAPRTVVLENAELAHTWEGRPAGSICLGIRSVSVIEKDSIIKEALLKAVNFDDPDPQIDRQEVFDTEQVRLFVARSVCDPNDVTRCHPLFPAPDLQIPRCLTPRAINRVFDACERLAVETSPISPEISDEDLELLAMSLNGDTLRAMPGHKEARARRWLWFLLEEIKNHSVI